MQDTEHERERQAELLWQIIEKANVCGAEGESVALEKFGMEVTVLRGKLGLSLASACEQSGVSPQVWLAIELGQASLDDVSTHLHSIGDTLGGQYLYLSRLLARLVVET